VLVATGRVASARSQLRQRGGAKTQRGFIPRATRMRVLATAEPGPTLWPWRCDRKMIARHNRRFAQVCGGARTSWPQRLSITPSTAATFTHPEISFGGAYVKATPGAAPPAKGFVSSAWCAATSSEHKALAELDSDGAEKLGCSARTAAKCSGAHIYGLPRRRLDPGDRQRRGPPPGGAANRQRSSHPSHPSVELVEAVLQSRPRPTLRTRATIVFTTISTLCQPAFGDSPPSPQSTGEGGPPSVRHPPQRKPNPVHHPRKDLLWRRIVEITAGLRARSACLQPEAGASGALLPPTGIFRRPCGPVAASRPFDRRDQKRPARARG